MAMKARMKGGPRRKATSLTVMAKMWPTATARDSVGSGAARYSDGLHVTLTDRAVRQWPTPKASVSGPDFAKARGDRPGSRSPSLPTVAATWPTPQARDHKGHFPLHKKGGRDLPGQAIDFHSGLQDPTTTTAGARSSNGMVLNPPFVEWLMGWPIGWTDCTRSATESFRSWLQPHFSALRAGPAWGS